VYAESRTAAPMMPLRMYGSGGFTVATAVAALVNISFYGLLFVLSLFFQRTWHESPIAAGLAFLPMTASIMLGNLTSGTLIRRFGARATIVAASALAAVGYGAAFPTVDGHSYVWLAVPLLLVGASAGVVVPATTNAVLSAVDPESAGTAAGAFNTLRQLGGIVGVAVMGLVAGAGTAAGVGACVLLAGATQVVSVILAAAGIRGSSSR
ncbi:MAG TPA: MFS transporter, partial [Pseudonocardiaceae bacterium]|nr:MFS transporter [Pseudonocardiaceae bacterium]